MITSVYCLEVVRKRYVLNWISLGGPPGVHFDVFRQSHCPLITKEPVCVRPPKPITMVKATNGGKRVVWKLAFRPQVVALIWVSAKWGGSRGRGGGGGHLQKWTKGTSYYCVSIKQHIFHLWEVPLELFCILTSSTTTFSLFYIFFRLIFYVNFAVNFPLYAACGLTFRQALQSLCSRTKIRILACIR